MPTPRLLFACSQSSIRAEIAAEVVHTQLPERFVVSTTRAEEARLEDADLVVVLGLDGANLAPPCPLLRWDIDEPKLAVDPGPFDMVRHAKRVVRLGVEARLGLLEAALGLPAGLAVGPRDAALTVVVTRNGATAGEASLEQVGAFGVIRISHGDDLDPRVADLLVADRVALARYLGVVALYAVADASYALGRSGFAVTTDVPKAVADGIAGELVTLQLRDDRATDALLDQGIERELARQNQTLIPPWARHPTIPRRSIGWRMGGGEWYLTMWHRWWARLPDDAKARYSAEWLPRTPPEFAGWLPLA